MAGEIKITINKKTGNIKMEGIGYQGPQCAKDIDEVMKAIGGRMTSRQAKPEYQRLVKVQKAGRQ